MKGAANFFCTRCVVAVVVVAAVVVVVVVEALAKHVVCPETMVMPQNEDGVNAIKKIKLFKNT